MGKLVQYDHIVSVYDCADALLYVRILRVNELNACPFGHETHRQELEAKIVGIVYSIPQCHHTLESREFIPTCVLHEIAKAGLERVKRRPTDSTADGGRP